MNVHRASLDMCTDGKKEDHDKVRAVNCIQIDNITAAAAVTTTTSSTT